MEFLFSVPYDHLLSRTKGKPTNWGSSQTVSNFGGADFYHFSEWVLCLPTLKFTISLMGKAGLGRRVFEERDKVFLYVTDTWGAQRSLLTLVSAQKAPDRRHTSLELPTACVICLFLCPTASLFSHQLGGESYRCIEFRSWVPNLSNLWNSLRMTVKIASETPVVW